MPRLRICAASLLVTLASASVCQGADGPAASHPYGMWSLAPPLVAVVLAIVTRRIVLSLLLGIFAGALITSAGDPIKAVCDFAEIHLWSTLTDPGKLRLFAFTLAIGATVGVIYANGGMRGFVGLLQPLARTRRSGQITAWLAGMFVFFDDYANTLLLGNTFRGTFDRLKLSREKLAYVVDSTSAPIAGLALISTWIAVELEYIQDGIKLLDETASQDMSPFSLFIDCLPYRFYVIQALLFVPIVAIMGRDFGPMLTAERRRLERDNVEQVADVESELELRGTSHWANAVVPLVVMLAVVLGLIVQTGLATVQQSAMDAHQKAVAELAADPAAQEALEASFVLPQLSFGILDDVFGQSSSSLALQYGGLIGLLVAIAISLAGKLLTFEQCTRAAGLGAKMMLPALVILLLASGLSRMTGSKPYYDVPDDKVETAFEYSDHRLYTGDYMVARLQEFSQDETSANTLRVLLPTIIFVLSAAVAFSTGTSYGTMGLMVPMVLPLSVEIIRVTGGDSFTNDPCLLASLGSVLAGAIFGDHCSPLSDTTILSSQASGCDHVAHVNTQLPYALLVGGVAIVLGTLAAGLGVPVLLLLPLQTASLVGLLWFLGKKVAD